MTDVFLSYAHSDQTAAEQIIAGLETEGFSVWWDHTIPPGQTWDTTIARRLTEAKAVVVLWSEASVGSEWVKEEASVARASNKYFPATIDGTPPPLGFSRVQAALLAGWTGDTAEAHWQRLVTEIAAALDAVEGLAVATASSEKGRVTYAGRSLRRQRQSLPLFVTAVVALLVGGLIGRFISVEPYRAELAAADNSLAMERSKTQKEIDDLTASWGLLQEKIGVVRNPKDYAAIDILRAELSVASKELEDLSRITNRAIPSALFEEIRWRQASIDLLNERLAQVRKAITVMSEKLPVGGPLDLAPDQDN